jgi:hypothetical protein
MTFDIDHWFCFKIKIPNSFYLVFKRKTKTKTFFVLLIFIKIDKTWLHSFPHSLIHLKNK